MITPQIKIQKENVPLHKMESTGDHHINQAVQLGHQQPHLIWCDLYNGLTGKMWPESYKESDKSIIWDVL